MDDAVAIALELAAELRPVLRQAPAARLLVVGGVGGEHGLGRYRRHGARSPQCSASVRVQRLGRIVSRHERLADAPQQHQAHAPAEHLLVDPHVVEHLRRAHRRHLRRQAGQLDQAAHALGVRRLSSPHSRDIVAAMASPAPTASPCSHSL